MAISRIKLLNSITAKIPAEEARTAATQALPANADQQTMKIVSSALDADGNVLLCVTYQTTAEVSTNGQD